MSLAAVLPLLAAVLIAAMVAVVHRRVHPRVAATMLTLSICAVSAAVIPTVALIAVGFLVHLPLLGHGFEWCRMALGLHTSAGPGLGALATAMVAIGLLRSARSLRAWRRHRCCEAGAPSIVAAPDWFAYALPGPGGRVALSSGLVDALDPEELAVVLAHEAGHVRHRHDRHLLAAELAAAFVPPLEWWRRRLRFSIERWADEDAVDALGGDRSLVARTLTRVALGPTAVRPGLAGFGGHGVAARVEALLDPRPLAMERVWSTTIGAAVVAVVVAALVQTHHLADVIVTWCGS